MSNEIIPSDITRDLMSASNSIRFLTGEPISRPIVSLEPLDTNLASSPTRLSIHLNRITTDYIEVEVQDKKYFMNRAEFIDRITGKNELNLNMHLQNATDLEEIKVKFAKWVDKFLL